MNRSNVGNITTNAMQTLNISATAAAASIRRSIADASKSLNADTQGGETGRANLSGQMEQTDIAEKQAKTKYYEAKAADLQSRTEARNLRTEKIKNVGTPQASEIAKKVDNDINWAREFYGKVKDSGDGLADTIKELTSGGGK